MLARTLAIAAAIALAAATLVATPVAAGPCANADTLCWHLEAVRLVNDMRARLARLPPLAVGTFSALDNAVRHSRFLVNGPFRHQNLAAATREIGCNTFVSGENIAKGSPGRDNPAATCVQIWEHSKGHRDNILSTTHKETVVGIVSTGAGYWCTQTFQTRGRRRTGPRCQPAVRGRRVLPPVARVSMAAGRVMEQTPVQAPPRMEEHVL